MGPAERQGHVVMSIGLSYLSMKIYCHDVDTYLAWREVSFMQVQMVVLKICQTQKVWLVHRAP